MLRPLRRTNHRPRGLENGSRKVGEADQLTIIAGMHAGVVDSELNEDGDVIALTNPLDDVLGGRDDQAGVGQIAR